MSRTELGIAEECFSTRSEVTLYNLYYDGHHHLNVLVPVGPTVLVVEADGVHHLMLDVTHQVRTFTLE